MAKTKSNSSGFTAIETLLVLIFVAIVAFAGCYVWHTQHDKTKPVANASGSLIPATTKTTTTQTNPYDGWKTYSLAYEKLKFQYPADWQVDDESQSTSTTNKSSQDDVTFTAPDGSTFGIATGESNGGDPIVQATSEPVQVTFLGQPAYLVFTTE